MQNIRNKLNVKERKTKCGNLLPYLIWFYLRKVIKFEHPCILNECKVKDKAYFSLSHEVDICRDDVNVG